MNYMKVASIKPSGNESQGGMAMIENRSILLTACLAACILSCGCLTKPPVTLGDELVEVYGSIEAASEQRMLIFPTPGLFYYGIREVPPEWRKPWLEMISKCITCCPDDPSYQPCDRYGFNDKDGKHIPVDTTAMRCGDPSFVIELFEPDKEYSESEKKFAIGFYGRGIPSSHVCPAPYDALEIRYRFRYILENSPMWKD